MAGIGYQPEGITYKGYGIDNAGDWPYPWKVWTSRFSVEGLFVMLWHEAETLEDAKRWVDDYEPPTPPDETGA